MGYEYIVYNGEWQVRMIPVYITTYATDTQNLVTEVFKRSANILGILKSVGAEIQVLEDALNGYITTLPLTPTSVGDLLDKYGKIVAEPRNGRTDADYYPALILKMRVLRSAGAAEDIIQIGTLTKHDVLTYVEVYPAGFILVLGNLQGPGATIGFIKKARLGGVLANIVYTTWPDGGDFVWGSQYDASAGELGYGSVYNANVGGLQAAVGIV
jgi:hypothetical protein